MSIEEKFLLRNQIESAVLTTAKLKDDVINETEAYLRLVSASAQALIICEDLHKEAVLQAKRANYSWATMGDLLGISRQAMQQRFGLEKEDELDHPKTKRLKGASAFNEMQLLENEAKEGWHLIKFGMLYLELEMSNFVWEHKREIAGFSKNSKKTELEKQGWIYVGSWLPFLYFKRQTNEYK